MVGPAGSTSEGVLSCTYACAEDTPCSPGRLLLDDWLLDDWAAPQEAEIPIKRLKKAAEAK
jgi:hypothetical protein